MPIDPITGAAIISTAATAGNAIATGNMNRKNRAFSEHMYDKQYRDNVSFWNQQNEYNNPSSQMQRLEDAGLNKHLIYGQPSGNVAGTAQSIKTPDVQSYQHRQADFGGFANIGRTLLHDIADLDIKQAQKNNLETDNTNKIKQGLLLDVQTGQQSFDLQYAKKLESVNADVLRQQLKNLETQQQYQLGKNEREAALTGATLNESMERVLKLRAETANTQEQKKEIQARIQGIRNDNTLKGLSIDLKKMGIEQGDPWYFRVIARLLNANEIHDAAKTKLGIFKP